LNHVDTHGTYHVLGIPNMPVFMYRGSLGTPEYSYEEVFLLLKSSMGQVGYHKISRSADISNRDVRDDRKPVPAGT
jgi:hypothetical protein